MHGLKRLIGFFLVTWFVASSAYAEDSQHNLIWSYYAAEGFNAFTMETDNDKNLYLQLSPRWDGIYLINYRFRPNGSLDWVYSDTSPDTWIWVGGDNGVHYLSNEYGLRAVDLNKNTLWTYKASIDRYHVAISPDKTLYVGTTKGLVALDSNGHEKWRNAETGSWLRDLMVGESRTIYALSNNELDAVSPNGQTKWTYKHPKLLTNAVEGENGELYLSDYEGRLITFDANGKEILNQLLGNGPDKIIFANHHLYLINRDKLVVLDPRDNTRKTVDLEFPGAGFYIQFAVGKDGSVYYQATGGKLVVFDANYKIKWQMPMGEGRFHLSKDGTMLYVYSSETGYVSAFMTTAKS